MRSSSSRMPSHRCLMCTVCAPIKSYYIIGGALVPIVVMGTGVVYSYKTIDQSADGAADNDEEDGAEVPSLEACEGEEEEYEADGKL